MKKDSYNWMMYKINPYIFEEQLLMEMKDSQNNVICRQYYIPEDDKRYHIELEVDKGFNRILVSDTLSEEHQYLFDLFDKVSSEYEDKQDITYYYISDFRLRSMLEKPLVKDITESSLIPGIIFINKEGEIRFLKEVLSISENNIKDLIKTLL